MNANKEKESESSAIRSNKWADKLFENRIITIYGEINQRVAREVTEKILALSLDNDEPIKIFINSQGGHVESGDTIYDMIRFVQAPVKIIGTGWVASAGALIYAAAKKENRYALPNTRFMLHQPMGGVGGQATDINIEAQEILKMRDRLNQIFSDATGRDIKKIELETDRNFWMSPEEAKKYGLVGKIISHIKEL
ncbi:MAG: ATP-dependent Clp protease proteolytic subunit [Candidatus Methylacidiphilales bacterium]